MSTDSCTIDTEDWQGADVCTIGDVGGGLLGSEIAASGTNGPGYAYNDLSLPVDAGKEICGRITTWPVDGTLYAYEDTSFAYVPASDGARSFQYQLYVDYVPVGSPQTVTLTSGGANATASGATLTGASTITPGTATGQISATATGATLTGTSNIAAGTATGAAAGTAPGATLTGSSTISAGAASGQASATASGATLSGISSVQAGAATGGGAASATAPGALLVGVSSIAAGVATNGSAPYVSPSRTVTFDGFRTTVAFEGQTTLVRFQ